MSAVPILLGAPGLHGEPELVTALTRPGTPVTVVRRCVDAVDLLGAAASGAARVAVIGPALPRLARDTVARLNASHLRVVGITSVGDDSGERHLRSLDVPVITVPPDDPAAAVGVLARAVDDRRPTTWEYSGEGTAPTPLHQPDAPGRLVAVWGPTGAPGRTSVAITLADECARAGSPALLVDADTYGGAIAGSLGLMEDVSGIVVACRHADSGTLDMATLAQSARALSEQFRVVTGITRPDRWSELRPAALSRLWSACRETPGITFIDTGFSLESDEEYLSDTRTPRRNAATLTALAAADHIIAVGSAEPVAMDRLVTGLADLRRIAGETAVHVVVTRVRRTSLGSHPTGQIEEALMKHAGVSAVTCVPDDRPAFDRCMREGRTLAEVAPRSAARSSLRGLAQVVMSSIAVSEGAPRVRA